MAVAGGRSRQELGRGLYEGNIIVWRSSAGLSITQTKKTPSLGDQVPVYQSLRRREHHGLEIKCQSINDSDTGVGMCIAFAICICNLSCLSKHHNRREEASTSNLPQISSSHTPLPCPVASFDNAIYGADGSFLCFRMLQMASWKLDRACGHCHPGHPKGQSVASHEKVSGNVLVQMVNVDM